MASIDSSRAVRGGFERLLEASETLGPSQQGCGIYFRLPRAASAPCINRLGLVHVIDSSLRVVCVCV
jgi:hypothetical protein